MVALLIKIYGKICCRGNAWLSHHWHDECNWCWKMAKLAPGEEDTTSEEPLVEIFASYAGSYTSPAPDGGEHSSEFTTNVEVGLDIEFNIVKLEVSDYASPPKFLKDNELEQLVSFIQL